MSETTAAQQEILESRLMTLGFNCVISLPTGSGKTWLAQKAIAETLSRGKRAIYLSPLKALALELYERWKVEFAAYKVGVFTGDFDRSKYPVSYQDSQLLVMTPERMDAVTRNWKLHWGWIPEVDLIVADELHLLGELTRGASLEGGLLRMRRHRGRSRDSYAS